MNILSEEHFDRMCMMCKKFNIQSKEENLFLPEYLASKEINEIIKRIENLAELDFKTIIEIIKKTENSNHYSGSLWYDYKIHLSAILKENGFKSSII